MFKLLRRLMLIAAIGAVISFVLRRKNEDDEWDTDDLDDDWGVEETTA